MSLYSQQYDELEGRRIMRELEKELGERIAPRVDMLPPTAWDSIGRYSWFPSRPSKAMGLHDVAELLGEDVEHIRKVEGRALAKLRKRAKHRFRYPRPIGEVAT